MAKYKLKASMITPLTDAGYISGGNMILSVPTRSQGESEHMFRMTWVAASEALQTTNQKGMIALLRAASPPLKINGSWKIADPSLPWFDELPDEDPTPAEQVGSTDGVEVLARWERKLIISYCSDTGTPKPADMFDTKANLQSILDDALEYYGRTP